MKHKRTIVAALAVLLLLAHWNLASARGNKNNTPSMEDGASTSGGNQGNQEGNRGERNRKDTRAQRHRGHSGTGGTEDGMDQGTMDTRTGGPLGTGGTNDKNRQP